MAKTSPYAVVTELVVIDQPIEIAEIEGEAFELRDDGTLGTPLTTTGHLMRGDAIYVSGSTTVVAGEQRFEGRRRGRSYSFVAGATLRVSPGRQDVPRIMRDLERLEKHMEGALGKDPLASHEPPTEPVPRAYATDYAFANLTVEESRELEEQDARTVEAVVLFFAAEAAHVAMSTVSVQKLRMLMRTLDRPVNPHIVDAQTISTLLDAVYGAGVAS